MMLDSKFIVEHWRDGECIESFELTNKIITTYEDDVVRIVFPLCRVEFVTDDELHFNLHDAADVLKHV